MSHYCALVTIMRCLFEGLWKQCVPMFLLTLLVGGVYEQLVVLLPFCKSLPAEVLLAGVVAIAWWQWDRAECLRARLQWLEMQRAREN